MITEDSLTGLPSKVALAQEIQSTIKNNSLFALIQLDFSRFSLISSSLGHEIGDRLLQIIAKHLQKCLREKDYIARMGADNFYLLLRNRENKEEIIKFVEFLFKTFRKSFAVDNYEIFVNFNLGTPRRSDKAFSDSLFFLTQFDVKISDKGRLQVAGVIFRKL